MQSNVQTNSKCCTLYITKEWKLRLCVKRTGLTNWNTHNVVYCSKTDQYSQVAITNKNEVKNFGKMFQCPFKVNFVGNRKTTGISINPEDFVEIW